MKQILIVLFALSSLTVSAQTARRIYVSGGRVVAVNPADTTLKITYPPSVTLKAENNRFKILLGTAEAQNLAPADVLTRTGGTYGATATAVFDAIVAQLASSTATGGVSTSVIDGLRADLNSVSANVGANTTAIAGKASQTALDQANTNLSGVSATASQALSTANSATNTAATNMTAISANTSGISSLSAQVAAKLATSTYTSFTATLGDMAYKNASNLGNITAGSATLATLNTTGNVSVGGSYFTVNSTVPANINTAVPYFFIGQSAGFQGNTTSPFSAFVNNGYAKAGGGDAFKNNGYAHRISFVDTDGSINFQTTASAGTQGSAITYLLPLTLLGNNAIFYGKALFLATNAAAGVTGNQTQNTASGTVRFAAGATSLTVTNSLATTNSKIFITVLGSDATAKSGVISAKSSGSFTITLNAAATAETALDYFLIN